VLNHQNGSATDRVIKVVQRVLLERSITQDVHSKDDLRATGLSSLDMVNLMLSVEAEFDIEIPETEITPANFRSISTISTLITVLLART
jgi:acyl carrier protein